MRSLDEPPTTEFEAIVREIDFADRDSSNGHSDFRDEIIESRSKDDVFGVTIEKLFSPATAKARPSTLVALRFGPSAAVHTPLRAVAGPSFAAGSITARVAAWPRYMQLLSIVGMFTVTLLAVADVTSAGFGLGIGCFLLACFFAANYAAWRLLVPNWLVGPSFAIVGTWASLIIVVSVAANAITSS